jgi:hypothetical protein
MKLYGVEFELRSEPINNSPKTIATIHDSLKLASVVLQRISST